MGGMNQSFDTGLASLARFIHEKGILAYVKNGKIEMLSIRSIETELSSAWKEIREEREEDAR